MEVINYVISVKFQIFQYYQYSDSIEIFELF